VRELENTIERAVALGSRRGLSIEDLPARIRECGQANSAILSCRQSESA
jgi:DNA-binding NtrC family response regulator